MGCGLLPIGPKSNDATNPYYAKYEAMSSISDETPELVDRVHQDLKKALRSVHRKGDGRYRYTSEILPHPTGTQWSVDQIHVAQDLLAAGIIAHEIM